MPRVAVHAVLDALPTALYRLRTRAGYTTLRPAAEAIRKATGQTVSRATLSNWERGTMPRADQLLYFLLGLGYSFRDLQGAIDEALAEDSDPALVIADRLRHDPGTRSRLRAFLETEPGSLAAADLLACLDDLEAGAG